MHESLQHIEEKCMIYTQYSTCLCQVECIVYKLCAVVDVNLGVVGFELVGEQLPVVVVIVDPVIAGLLYVEYHPLAAGWEGLEDDLGVSS